MAVTVMIMAVTCGYDTKLGKGVLPAGACLQHILYDKLLFTMYVTATVHIQYLYKL